MTEAFDDTITGFYNLKLNFLKRVSISMKDNFFGVINYMYTNRQYVEPHYRVYEKSINDLKDFIHHLHNIETTCVTTVDLLNTEGTSSESNDIRLTSATDLLRAIRPVLESQEMLSCIQEIYNFDFAKVYYLEGPQLQFFHTFLDLLSDRDLIRLSDALRGSPIYDDFQVFGPDVPDFEGDLISDFDMDLDILTDTTSDLSDLVSQDHCVTPDLTLDLDSDLNLSNEHK